MIITDKQVVSITAANMLELEVPQELPFLQAICWQIADIKCFTPKEMLGCYEDGWHYIGVLGEPSLEEIRFIKQLIKYYGSWLAARV